MHILFIFFTCSVRLAKAKDRSCICNDNCAFLSLNLFLPGRGASENIAMCLCGKQLATVFAFQGTFLNSRMRYGSFLPSKMYYRLKHKFAEKKFVRGVGSGSKLRNKVVALMDYNLNDLIGNGSDEMKSEMSLKDALDDLDISLMCKRFPSITLGSAPRVELYDGTASCSETMNSLATENLEHCFSDSLEARWVQNTVSEEWPSLSVNHSTITSSTLGKAESCPSRVLPSVYEEKLDQVIREDSQMKVGLQSQSDPTPSELFLDKSVSCILGLSKRHYQQLDNCGFHTLRKLLLHFPRSYANLQNAHAKIDDGQYLIFVGKVLSSRGVKANYSFSFLEVVVGCQIAQSESTSECVTSDAIDVQEKTIYLHLKKFFRGSRFTFKPFLKSLEEKYQEGDIVCVSGKVRTMRAKDHYEMREYNIDVLEDGKDLSFFAKERPYPIYPSKGRLNPTFLRDTIARALQALPVNVDPIPKDIREQFGLLSLHDAYFGIHKPKDINEADLARKRLIFDEFFYLQLGRLFQMLESLGTQIEKDGLLDKYRRPENNAVCTEEWSSLTKKVFEVLPYTLTTSQLHAVSEIIWDLKRPVPMNRLLQGDVGCGKTVVAFLACMEVIGSGYQAAFMVPTELLAIQHYEHLLKLLENMDEVTCKPTVALLTGSTPLKQTRMIRKGIQTGEISMVIGTHSLIAESVEFLALRIAVVDEQHRFGVIQRGRFNSKLYCASSNSNMEDAITDDSAKSDAYMAPHVLAMSATPIPRTLALALYGDMSLTQITDLPPGRIPVQTFTIEGNDKGFEDVYKMMLDELEDGGKVYLVFPIIELSEQLPQLHAASADLEVISQRFQGYNCGLLHGKMKSDEKEETLRKFRTGEIHILLATQVIEIGVDVPDASMMVVLNSERFGIAQLHQLRGRVGRGTRPSKCILVASTASSLNRLKVLEQSSDGFYLANMDLLLRGPGDLLGKKQSGHLPEFPVARLEVDGNILQDAHVAALKIISSSHDLEQFPALKLELSMRQPLCLLGD
ncbi:ATP-dependent DNA helicase homolog RECG, chloroplastic isoform X2 [Cajanus cajan]|uniref:ATP-dependent DNA helicase homolog RECG, chloroplastic isoform X2 n=1 Tax=Cajanus cajan TaxID=3821 RepID=UPI0010FAEDE9|nr:ATP-dependent DNA helicase homolog RECG, chloroplastic isoform X2 [Cajanus cajan]